MSSPQPWIKELVSAFRALGGAARYDDLYEYIQRTTERNLTTQWKATIRRTIEDHSSDSKNFRSDNFFRHIGSGFWGLRESANLDELIIVRRDKSSKSVVDEALTSTTRVIDGRLVFVKEHWRRWPSNYIDGISVKLDRFVFRVVDGWTTDQAFELKLAAGLVISVPFEWHPVLAEATKDQRRAVEFGEYGAYWTSLDLEILVPEILTSAASKVAIS